MWLLLPRGVLVLVVSRSPEVGMVVQFAVPSTRSPMLLILLAPLALRTKQLIPVWLVLVMKSGPFLKMSSPSLLVESPEMTSVVVRIVVGLLVPGTLANEQLLTLPVVMDDMIWLSYVFSPVVLVNLVVCLVQLIR